MLSVPSAGAGRLLRSRCAALLLVAVAGLSAAEGEDPRCRRGDPDLESQCAVLEEDDDVAFIQGRLSTIQSSVDNFDAEYSSEYSAWVQADESSADAASSSAKTLRTTTEKPLIKGTKIKVNEAGDLPAFFSSLRFNIMIIVLMLVIFTFGSRWYPQVYSYRATAETYPELVPDKWNPWEVKTWFEWAKAALILDTGRIEETCGLDNAMLLEFTVMSMQLMLIIGLPCLFIGIPVYAFAGGGFAKKDRLSWAGVGNVVYRGGPINLTADDAKLLPQVQWIWWLLSFAVWCVVVVSQAWLFRWQRLFIPRREAWLKATPAPFATSILVEGIPDEFCTDADLKKYFADLFGSAGIKDAFVVKRLSGSPLEQLIAKYMSTEQSLHEVDFKVQEARRIDPVCDMTLDTSQLKKEVDQLKLDIKAEQDRLKALAASPVESAERTALYSSTGFVTFEKRSLREMALNVHISYDSDDWIVSEAPDPANVIWQDLMINEAHKKVDHFIGYGLVLGLGFIYMPIVLAISNLSRKLETISFVKSLLTATGMMSTADGVLATLGLTFMTSFLPTFLMWIFTMFFVFRSEGWKQLKLQQMYFWFLMIFVLLVPAIGTNLEATMEAIVKNPLSAFTLIAQSLPITTHFFINFVAMQPTTHAMNLTRYMPLAKFLLFKQVCDEERAHELSEPEDQDYYGLGSRSARFTLVLLIGLVFGTICPLIHIVVFTNFLVCRIVYGYLIPFAESKKNDLGGYHWCHQLIHVHHGILIYIIMMVGILTLRSESKLPPAIAAVSFIWWLLSYMKYNRALTWENVAFKTAVEDDTDGGDTKKRKAFCDRYMQKEIDNVEWLPE